MDMAEQLDEFTYQLLVTAPNGVEARRRLAIVIHWAAEQDARLAGRRPLRVDHTQVVSEALDEQAANTAA